MGNEESRELQDNNASDKPKSRPKSKSNNDNSVPPAVQKFVDLAEKFANENILTYYFKATREITKDELKSFDFQPKVNHEDVVSFTSTGKIESKFWHLAVIKNGSKTHHGKEFILPDQTKVIVTVSNYPAVQVLSCVGSSEDEAAELLKMLPILSEAQVEKLECVVKMFIFDGKIAIDKRASVVQHITEKLMDQGVSIAAKILPQFGLQFLDDFLQLPENEQRQYYETLFLTIASVGVSLSNVSQSIKHVLNADDKFREEVLKWLGPVLKSLEKIILSTHAAIKCMEDFSTTNSEQSLVGAFVAIGDIASFVKTLLGQLPAIRQKAIMYATEMDKVRTNERDKAIASFVMSITEGGLAAAEMWKTGWKALSSLQKGTVIAGFLRAGAGAVEYGASTYAYLVIDSYMERTKLHLKFYDNAKEVLDSYDKTLTVALSREEKRMVIHLLEHFKNHEKELCELLEQGKKLT